MMIIVVILTTTNAPFSFGAVSPEEAAKLGTTLTGIGAEVEGNKDGTIPPYTGGLTTPPANYKIGSGMRPDPFAEQKPLFSINAQNMSQYADKLTEGTKALMKKSPIFRIDVYKTHRTVAYPTFVLKNTAKNAVKATTANGGLSLRNAHAGTPFPIPKDGYEVMWNHLVRFMGRSIETQYSSHVIDTTGRLTNISSIHSYEEFPYYDEDMTRSDTKLYWKARYVYNAPPRKVGDVVLLLDPINMYEEGRTAYEYIPGQRRVKLAPEIGFDIPNPATGGNTVYDENYGFNGSLERFDWKLVGKKEIYVPYNAYRTIYMVKSQELFAPKHMNPDKVRWELHRMWVVEATLKPGKRHTYPKRMYYLDEDSWGILASESYEDHGDLYKVNFCFLIQNYDIPAPYQRFYVSYNVSSGIYAAGNWPGEDGYVRKTSVSPDFEHTSTGFTKDSIR
jgi:hypothetical protein